ncbi:hypothetical protein [Desulfosporosinus lacus]|uniref:PAS fold-containing protein n=1 Tax=Desulfosporosinus lacus DSM 15449 TaxID=1121420 RepID=A0A1M6F2T0_9FIRM|nr:hypothetical protein [Desulfosporosinus lacus]SHI91992.1 hypothetical protein SAMN02746098_04865 [Desulfosporosinus lacus DSM 15449]
MFLSASSVIIDERHYFAGIGIDITEWKLLHKRLRKYQVLAEKANDAAVRIYGYTYTELLSMTIFNLRNSSTSTKIIEQMDLADKDGIIFDTVYPTRTVFG